MASEFLIDTNLLIYVFDINDPIKQAQAESLVKKLGENAALSTQTLAEFFIGITRRITPPLTSRQAYQHIEAFAEAFRVVEITKSVILDAARASRDYQMHYWDAQVWATAKLYQIPYVLTEDIPGRKSLEGVRFLNPFAADFDMSLLEPEGHRK
jgi:predicted nucleic acid-binding protein